MTLSEQTKDRPTHQPFPADDEGAPKPAEETGSYSMVPPRLREIYFQFYRETYRPSVIDRKNKELIAIAASLTARCQGCIEGHIRKALKFGASHEEVGEAIGIAIGVNAAAMVDLTDIAAESMDLKLY